MVSKLFGGGSSGSQTTSSTQTIEPPAYLRPGLELAATEAQRLYQTSAPQMYPGQMYVSPSSQTNQALQMAENRALSGSPLTAQANKYFSDVAGGSYLDPSFIEAQLKPVVENFNRSVLPGIQSQFSRAGRYGSGAQAEATSMAGQDLASIMGSIVSQNLQAERNRQQQAAGMLPSLADAEYSDIARLAGVGQAREAIAAQPLAEQINRFNFAQNLDQLKLSQLLANLGANPATQYTTTNSSQTARAPKADTFTQMLGLATAAAPYLLAPATGGTSLAVIPASGGAGGLPFGATPINTSQGLPWAKTYSVPTYYG